MSTAYNKLVRDKIPEIIRQNGGEPTVQGLSEEAYGIALVDKLREEVSEYGSAPAPDELADILEVVYALAKHQYDLTQEELEVIRVEKAKERGGFEERLFLVEVAE